MKVRPLVIDDEALKRIGELLVFANKRENWYLVANGRAGSPPPGDDPRYVAHFKFGYRAVFSVTSSAREGLFRHLTVSVNTNQPGLYPGVEAVWEIARQFGFTGPAPTENKELSTWIFDIHKTDHCVVVGQRLETANGEK